MIYSVNKTLSMYQVSVPMLNSSRDMGHTQIHGTGHPKSHHASHHTVFRNTVFEISNNQFYKMNLHSLSQCPTPDTEITTTVVSIATAATSTGTLATNAAINTSS